MSDTPRCDAAKIYNGHPNYPEGWFVGLDMAQELEKEVSSLRQALEQLVAHIPPMVLKEFRCVMLDDRTGAVDTSETFYSYPRFIAEVEKARACLAALGGE